MEWRNHRQGKEIVVVKFAGWEIEWRNHRQDKEIVVVKFAWVEDGVKKS